MSDDEGLGEEWAMQVEGDEPELQHEDTRPTPTHLEEQPASVELDEEQEKAAEAELERVRRRAARWGTEVDERHAVLVAEKGMSAGGMSERVPRKRQPLQRKKQEAMELGEDEMTEKQQRVMEEEALLVLEQAKKKARGERFGSESSTPKDHQDELDEAASNSLQGKDAVNLDLQRREDTVHIFCYGSTVRLETSHLHDYFSGYGMTRVEWIDDNHVNVVFVGKEDAFEALTQLSRPLPTEVEKLVVQYPDMEREEAEAIGWRVALDPDLSGITFLMRLANVDDKKLPFDMRKPSQWALSKINRRSRVSGERKRPREREPVERHDMHDRRERGPRMTNAEMRALQEKKEEHTEQDGEKVDVKPADTTSSPTPSKRRKKGRGFATDLPRNPIQRPRFMDEHRTTPAKRHSRTSFMELDPELGFTTRRKHQGITTSRRLQSQLDTDPQIKPRRRVVLSAADGGDLKKTSEGVLGGQVWRSRHAKSDQEEEEGEA